MDKNPSLNEFSLSSLFPRPTFVVLTKKYCMDIGKYEFYMKQYIAVLNTVFWFLISEFKILLQNRDHMEVIPASLKKWTMHDLLCTPDPEFEYQCMYTSNGIH